MNEEFEHIIPDDADDLSKDAPALFAMKGKDDGFVVPIVANGVAVSFAHVG